MHKRKLLIAEGSEELARALAELFQGGCQVCCCSDGGEAQRLLTRFRPHVLILDLMLPGYDGLSLLQWAADQGLELQVLATTRFCSDYVVETAQTLGVRYLMRKPCSVSALTARVTDLLLRDLPAAECRPASDEGIDSALMALGIPGKLRGSTYLRCAVPLYARDPLQSVTKVLYPEVAKRCGCAATHVERSIRSAIDAGWKNRDENIWRLYFPADETGTVRRPTNASFIAQLARSLEKKWEEMGKTTETEQNISEINGNVRE